MKKILVVTAITLGLVIPIHAGYTQTVFVWPESSVSVTQYRYLDNCVAAGARVWDSLRSAQAILLDTVFSARGQIGESAPAPVQKSLQECLSNHTPTQIPRAYTLLANKAYLLAGQFTEAEAVVRHGLTQIDPTDTASRTALIDSVIQQYAMNPPFQLHFVRAYIDTLERYGSAYRPWNLFRDYFWLMHAAYVANDDSLAFLAGRRLLELAPSAAKGVDESEVAAVAIGVRWALHITKGKELLDSLRKGTAAYAALHAEQFRQAIGFTPPDQPYNMEAPVLQGDYWFPKSAATQEYPRKGRVSLLVFVPDHMGGANTPERLLVVLRRLTRKYPTVDLLLVTSTVGSFGPLVPPTSDREAILSDSVFRHFHQLNPVLSITKGTFVQFDAPDNRRFYQPYPNLDAYPPSGGEDGAKSMRIFLIDGDRRIVDLMAGNANEEGWLTRLVETVLARTAGVQQQ